MTNLTKRLEVLEREVNNLKTQVASEQRIQRELEELVSRLVGFAGRRSE